MKYFSHISPKQLLALITVASAIPFLAVELFKLQLYNVMEVPSYLLFHNVTEFFSVMVSFSIFGLGWYAYDQNKDRHSLLLSVAFLAIGLIDFMHTLGYTGMPSFITPNNPNKSTLFWIAVRFFSAAAFLASAFVSSRSKSRWLSKSMLMTTALALSSTVFVAVTFFPALVPTTYIAGFGLTPFKRVTEFIIIGLLVLAVIAYWRRLSRSGDRLIYYYLAAFILCIFSELVFAVYKSVFDTYNVLGHVYKIIAFGLIYKGIFVASVRKPYENLLAANDNLRLNRNMLSHVINSIPQSVLWKDRESVYLGCNQVFARQAGIDDPDDIVGKCDFDLPWSREESEGYRADDREVMGRGKAKYHIIETQRQEDGTAIWLDTTKIPLTDGSGTVTGVLVVYEDITWRKQAEEDLRESLLFKQQILNCAQEGIIVYDRDLRYLVWNPFMERLSGLKADDVLGKTPLEVFPFLEDTGVLERLGRILAGEAVDAVEFPFHVPDTGKTGWTSDCSAPLVNAEGEVVGVIGTVRDTTESRKTEEQLRQSQKMEALGQLAGGVAHDFNNMLQVIIGYASLLKMDASGTQEGYITEILSSSERAAELTSGLLSYSRKQVFKLESTNLGKLVGGVEKFLHRILGEDIALVLAQPAEPLQAAIDRAHIQQVFINLATNARDAMPAGGTLSIHMEEVKIDEEFVHAHAFGSAGPYALITVTDTGSGIPKEALQKIFEPFFTTKGVGKGTGLGLSIVYGIITQHNGFINCYSEEGSGTTFRLYLPLSTEAVQSHEVVSPITTGEDSGKTILVVEDDPAVLKITRCILELHGYIVLDASSGRGALDLFREHREQIAVVLLDAVMPDMNGAETLAAIRELKPGTKALFMSGYAREIISGKMLMPDDAEFINKPVLPARLIEAIRNITKSR